MNYTESEKTVLPIYEAARQRKDLRVLIYNGDTDPGINSMVTQSKYTAYFDSLNVSETEAWRPWTTDGKQRMGGYVTTWEGDYFMCCSLLLLWLLLLFFFFIFFFLPLLVVLYCDPQVGKTPILLHRNV